MNPLARAARPLFVLLAALAAALGGTVQAAPAPLAPAEGEVIVRFRADAASLRKHALAAGARADAVRSAIDGRARALGERVGRPLTAGAAVAERIQVVRATGVDAATLARELAADPEVESATPNGRKRKVVAPNDPLYPASATERRSNGLTIQRGPAAGQWYLRKPDDTIKSAIDIEAAWDRTRGSGNVVVAVLDTGVRFDHPDLAGRLLPGYDFVSNPTVANDGDGRDADPSDPGDWVTSADGQTATFNGCDPASSSWHGTSTASLIGAQTGNALGMAGAAPGVLVQPVRVLGKCFGYDSDILAAMRWAAGLPVPGVPANPHPAKVINMSLGSPDPCDANYQQAVNEVLAKGVMIVAAAGNSAGGPVGSPASCPGVVAVGGLRHAGTKVGYSDLGPEIAISAPAGNCVNTADGTPCLYPILAATNTGTQGPVGSTWTDSYDITVGTSFASPLAASVAALVWSRRPELSVAQVRSALQSSARPFPAIGTDPSTALVCQPPQAGVEQLQCYCTTALCGAGMLDAGAAVAAVAGGAFVSVSYRPVDALAGTPIDFLITGTEVAPGRTVNLYKWTLLDGGGIANGFSTSDNAATAALTPTGAGTLRLSLTITDSLGETASTEQVVTVRAPAASPVPPASDSGGGGGGALSAAWLAGLALAVAGLRRARRRT